MAEALRKGIVEEDANRNLAAAIQSYQSVLAQYDEDRKSAGTALFRLAECYRKQGKNDQAAAAYKRVVQEFADQTKLAEQSRSHLPKGQQTGGADSAGVAEARRRVRGVLEERLKNAEDDLEKAQAAGGKVPMLRNLVAQWRAEMGSLDIRLEQAAKGPLAEGDAIRIQRENYRSGLEKAQEDLANAQAADNRIPTIKERIMDLRQQLAAFDLETAQQGAALAASPKR